MKQSANRIRLLLGKTLSTYVLTAEPQTPEGQGTHTRLSPWHKATTLQVLIEWLDDEWLKAQLSS
jgi:hypothetical protein